MENIKILLHLHKQQTKLEIKGTQVQIPNQTKKFNASIVVEDDQTANVETTFQHLLQQENNLFQTFNSGKTSTLISVGFNASHTENYNRLNLFSMALTELQSQINLQDPNYECKLSIAFLGLTDTRAVDLNTERNVDFSFLSEGLCESLYEPATDLTNILKWLKNGISLPGVLISVRLEKFSYENAGLIDRAMQANKDVFYSLMTKYTPESRSSVSYFNLLSFGAVRFSGDVLQLSSLSQTVLYLGQYIKYGDSKYTTGYNVLLKNVLQGNVAFVADMEMRAINKEVESAIDLLDNLSRFKVPVGTNIVDQRVVVMYYLERKANALNKQLAEKTAESQAYEDLSKQFTEKVVSQREELKSRAAKISALESEQTELKQVIATKTELSETFEQELIKANEIIMQSNEDVKMLEDKILELKAEIQELKKKLKKQVDSASKEISTVSNDLREYIEELESEKAELEKTLTETKKTLSEMKKTEKAFKGEVVTLKEQVEELESLKSLEKELSKSKKTETKLIDEVESLKDKVQELKSQLQESKKATKKVPKKNAKESEDEAETVPQVVENEFVDSPEKKAPKKKATESKKVVVDEDDVIMPKSKGKKNKGKKEEAIEEEPEIPIATYENLDDIHSGPELDGDFVEVVKEDKKKTTKRKKIERKEAPKKASEKENEHPESNEESDAEQRRPRKRKLGGKSNTPVKIPVPEKPAPISVRPIINPAAMGKLSAKFAFPKFKSPS